MPVDQECPRNIKEILEKQGREGGRRKRSKPRGEVKLRIKMENLQD